jgi:hypothetical protein
MGYLPPWSDNLSINLGKTIPATRLEPGTLPNKKRVLISESRLELHLWSEVTTKHFTVFLFISKCVSLLSMCVLSFQVTDCLTSSVCHNHRMCAYDTVSDKLCVYVLNSVKNLLSSILTLPVRQTRNDYLTTDTNGDSNRYQSVANIIYS